MEDKLQNPKVILVHNAQMNVDFLDDTCIYDVSLSSRGKKKSSKTVK